MLRLDNNNWKALQIEKSHQSAPRVYVAVRPVPTDGDVLSLRKVKMTELVGNARSKEKRASKPKVKTGCITCKKRRVKCDETKPECLRCQNFGCDCDGYEFTSRRIPRVVPKRPLIAKSISLGPKNSQRSSSGFWFDRVKSDKQADATHQALVNKSGNLGSLLNFTSTTTPYEQSQFFVTTENLASSMTVYAPSTSIFENDQEKQYFQFYCDTTSKQLSGGYGDGTWNHAFLQACHEEPFVRRAIIAIAALSKAMEVSQPGLEGIRALPDIKDASVHNTHHIFALQQYGKAIRDMREAMVKGDENIRMALISCLLTICFESFHGHHENALKQISLGLMLMQDWVKKQNPPKYMVGLRSPDPNHISDRLFHAFMRLDVGAMHFFDRRTSEFHREQSLEGTETLQNMPEVFCDLEQAGVYFAVVMKRVLHFVKWVESNTMLHHHQKETCISDAEMESSFPRQRLDSILNPTEEIKRYNREIDRWSAAFQPIMDRSRLPTGHYEYLPASFLKLHQILVFVLLQGLTCHEECLFDQFQSEYKEIISLADTVMGHPDLSHSAGKAVYVFDHNLVLPLLIVALKSREWILRRKAIELLQSNPRREGVWDSSLAAGMGQWFMSIEEEGLRFGEYIPERSRVRITSVKQNFRKRTAYVNCSQGVDGETRVHETVIRW